VFLGVFERFKLFWRLKTFLNMAPRGGLEPPTNGLTAQAKTPKNSLNRPTKALLKET